MPDNSTSNAPQPRRSGRWARLAALARMPWQEKLLLVVAWVLMLLAGLALKLVHTRRLVPLMGEQLGAEPHIPVIGPQTEDRARMIKRAIRRAATLTPLRSDCLPQALAGALLCRWLSVPATAFLGVRKTKDKPMEAHAWLCAGPVPVTGGNAFSEYSVVSCFAPPQIGKRA